MTQDTIKKAYKDLLIVVSYFRMVPNMISYLPESSQGNVRDVTIRVVEALDRINELGLNFPYIKKYKKTASS